MALAKCQDRLPVSLSLYKKNGHVQNGPSQVAEISVLRVVLHRGNTRLLSIRVVVKTGRKLWFAVYENAKPRTAQEETDLKSERKRREEER